MFLSAKKPHGLFGRLLGILFGKGCLVGENPDKLTGDAIELHKIQSARVDKIREDVTELMKTDLGLKSDVRDLTTKVDRLTERLDEGVSKTAFKTLEKVNDLSTEFAKFATEMHNDNKIRDLKIKRSDELWTWFIRSVLFVALAGAIIAAWKM